MMNSRENLQILIKKEKIQDKIKEISAQIQKDYKDEKLLILGILNGAFIFMADLIRELNLDLTLEFIKVSSYGNNTLSSGKVEISHLFDASKIIKGNHILIIEDIVDTGISLNELIKYIHKFSPKSLRLCALLYKPARQKVKVDIDYLGFEIPNKFVVGYGLDFNQKYRHLPNIYSLKNIKNLEKLV